MALHVMQPGLLKLFFNSKDPHRRLGLTQTPKMETNTWDYEPIGFLKDITGRNI